ncbi:MAG: hypothetical protein JO112_15070, partial [Planctomycetes bacterium]|nr:hypothetical protein [Planctomycetota bacterium]
PGTEPVPVPQLAEQIKALKAAHSIEATPERTRQHRASAEEPVTARIRRREGTTSAGEGGWRKKLAEEKANAGRVLELG